MEDDKKPEDFFSIIEKEATEERIENPFDDDEIIFKDASGNIKVIKGNQVEQTSAAPALGVKVKTVPKVKVKPSKPIDINKSIQVVVKKSGIHFNDTELEKRFKAIVQMRLKGIRSSIVTKEAFMDSILHGGMGFDAQHTDQLLKVINQQLGSLDEEARENVTDKPFSDLQAEATAILDKTAEPAPEVPAPEKPDLVFQSKEEKELAAKPKPAPPMKKAVKELAVKSASVPRVIVRTNSSKPKIEDVKFKPKLTGPVEEIRTMTIKDFRRLGEDASQSAQKVIEKIDVLEEESFSKKTDAIAAWKISPVNRLYLELGDASMEQKMSVAEIINTRKQNNQPYLTEEELDAVIDLNSKLRF